MCNVGKFYLLLILLAVFAGFLPAQITGDAKGVVLDPSNASIPRAKVTLTSLETGETRKVQTDVQGRFAFNLLKIGLYELTVEAPGFRTATTQVTVRTGEIAAVRFSMELGPVTETITVTDAVAVLDAENAQIQVAVQGQRVQEIPVLRDPNKFATIAPGVVPVSPNNSLLGSGSYNTNGGRGRGNNVTIDNITSTDISVTGTGGPLDALNFSQIKEVKLITNNFSAEYGRNSSSQLLYVTKSGENTPHGELYEFFRNDKLNARPFFDTSGKANIVRRNQYGYAFGGPVYIPGVYNGRDKTHFFTTYEGLKVRGAGTTVVAHVPTPAMLAQVTDPTAKALLQQYQLPAATRIGPDVGEVEQSAGTTTDLYQVSAKLDHRLSDSDILTGKYARAVNTTGSSGLTFIGTNLANFGATASDVPQQASLAETHLFSPTIVNEFRFGFGRSTAEFPINSTVPVGPRIRITNRQVDYFGQYEGIPQGRLQNTFQYSDTLSWVRNGHSVKLGVDVYRYQLNGFFDSVQRPRIDFADWAGFAAGKPIAVIQRFGSSVRGNRVTNHFYFLQDDWKVRRNFTLNLGVRVEVAGGVTEVNNLISNLDLNCRDSVGVAGSGPFGCFVIGKPSFGTNVNWAPRVGFAWNPWDDNRTVIRGGYGIAYDFIFMNAVVNQRFLPPFIITGQLSGQDSFTGANSLASIVAGTAQMQVDARSQTGKISPNVVNFGTVSPVIDEGLRNPQVHQFSLGVEREILPDFVLKASYVGTKGNYLQRTQSLNLIADPPKPATSVADETTRLAEFKTAISASTGGSTQTSNRIDPRYNEISYLTSSANSNYHSFQFEVVKSFAAGYMFRASYTFGKSIDDVSDPLGVLINDSFTQQNPLDNRNNRGPSQFDIRQRLVLTHFWELPWGRGISNPLLRQMASGWSLSGISTFRTGFPVTFTTGSRRGVSPITVNGISSSAAVRPDTAGPFSFRPMPSGSAGAPSGRNNDPVQPISAYAASLGLSQPLLGNFGTLGRNVSRLNGETNFDWAFAKNFPIREGLRLQLRGEFYNLFNNVTFQEVDGNISSPNFGQYTTVTTDARTVQLAVRIIF